MPADQHISFPIRGVCDRTPFGFPAQFTAPPGFIRNVRGFELPQKRGRGAKRPGAKRVFETQICAGKPIQCLTTVSISSKVTSYQATGCRMIADGEWEARSSGPLQGQTFMLGTLPSMFRDFDHTTYAGTKEGVACCWHPLLTNDIRRAFVVTRHTDAGVNGGQAFARVRCVDELGTELWQANMEDKDAGGALAGSPRVVAVNHVHCNSTLGLGNALVIVSAVLYGTGTQQGYLYVYAAADGTYLKRYDMDGWASEVQGVCTRTDGKIAALLWGSGGTAGTCQDGTPVETGGFGQFFRSGIMLFTPRTGADPLERTSFGENTTAPKRELVGSVHPGYWRFSEWLNRKPLGAFPSAIAAGPNASVIVSFSNRGWGPNASYPPADNSAPYTTVARVESTGVVSWEVDTDSIRRAYTIGATTYYCDIPNGGSAFTSEPISIFTVAVSIEDNVAYVGGARNSASTTATVGFSLFCISLADGRILWRTNMGSAASAFAGSVSHLVVDPSDRNLIVSAYRSSAWTGSTGDAHLFKVDAVTGDVRWSYCITDSDATATNMADADSRGRIVFVTPYVTA